MTGRDAHSALDEVAVESLLTGRAGSADPDLQRAVALLGTLADDPAPPPNAALADILHHGFEPAVVPFRRPAAPGRRWAARAGAGLAAAAASVLVAGTAAALPAPVQDTVADVVSALTPFELPRPPAAGEAEPADTDVVPTSGAPVAPTSSAPSTDRPAERTTDDSVETEPGDDGDDSSTVERQERERQRAAEEAAEQSQRAAEEAAEESRRAADDAADEAAEAERERQKVIDDAADDAEPEDD